MLLNEIKEPKLLKHILCSFGVENLQSIVHLNAVLHLKGLLSYVMHELFQ